MSVINGTDGIDVLTGTAEADSIYGFAGNDTLYGNEGDDLLDGGIGHDTMYGGAGDDTYYYDFGSDTAVEAPGEGVDTVISSIGIDLSANVENLVVLADVAGYGGGNELDNVIIGSDVGDFLVGYGGNDTIYGGDGNDWLRGYEGDDALYGQAGMDDLFGFTGNDYLDGGDGNDRLDGWTGQDTMLGGAGDDYYVVDDQGDVVTELAGEGVDTVESSISYQLPDQVENLILVGSVSGTGNAAANVITGSDADNFISGGGDDDVLDGGGGNDVLDGGAGDDLLVGGDGDDVIDISAGGNDTVIAGDGNDTIITRNGSFGVFTADDRIDGGAGSDTLVFDGDGFINYITLSGDEISNVETIKIIGMRFSFRLATSDATVSAGQTLLVDASQSALTEFGFLNFDGSAETDGSFVVIGSEANDVLVGGAGNDLLIGGAGADSLDGGAGADTLSGGAGDDTYVIGDAGDVVVESADEGVDIINSSITYLLGANLENLTLTGTAAINGTGNQLANTITGNSSANVLDGGAGDDLLIGGSGSDTYVLSRGMGYDKVQETVFSAPGDVDVVRVSADISPLDIRVRNQLFPVQEPMVPFQTDFVLSIEGSGDAMELLLQPQFGKVEQVIFSDGTIWNEADLLAKSLEATEGADYILGSIFNDTIHGLGGDDTLNGWYSNDTLFGGEGNDVLLGGGGTDALYGESGDDFLDAGPGGGNETLYGGAGSDTYVLRRGSGFNLAVEDEGAAGDIDTVQVSADIDPSQLLVRYQPPSSAQANDGGLRLLISGTSEGLLMRWNESSGPESEIERVVFADGTVWTEADLLAHALQGSTGNDLRIVGFSTDDYITGLAGIDTLLGGDGNDHLDGGADDDVLFGNAGNDTLDGGTGINSLSGGAGDDTYIVNGPGDRVFEFWNGGIDTVNSSISYALGTDVENLVLVGDAAVTGTGNSLDNVITGNSAANVLNGLQGNDTLIGGKGDDTYYVGYPDTTTIVENAGEGVDLVLASSSYTLSANVENLQLNFSGLTGTGNALDNQLTSSGGNTLIGAGGNDTLNSFGSGDTLIGGTGNDSYQITESSTAIVENAGEGNDFVSSWASYTLAANLEGLQLLGLEAINGTGNALANTIYGNSAGNVLDGGAGADSMLGLAGDDTYVVDNAGDTLSEFEAQGNDTVRSSISYTLGANVENLTLTGTSNIAGTGNSLDNTLVGNSGRNTLTGDAGNDWLDGGAGNDTLAGGTGDDTYVVDGTGDIATENANEGTDAVRSSVSWTLGANFENLTLTGTGNINGTGNAANNVLTGNSGSNKLTGGTGSDTYVMGRGAGADTVVENDSTAGNTDVAQFLSGIAADQLWFQRAGNSLEVSIIGTSDSMTIQKWYVGTANHVEQFKTADGKTLLDSNVQNLVNAMAAFSPPAPGQETLPPDYAATLTPVIAANWQ